MIVRSWGTFPKKLRRCLGRLAVLPCRLLPYPGPAMEPIKLTVTIRPTDKTALDAICLRLGYVRADRANISALMRAIADGSLRIETFKNALELIVEETDDQF